MCFHLSAKSNKELLEKRFNAKAKPILELVPHYYINGFNHSQLPVITAQEPDTIQTFYWGLIPPFAKDTAEAKVRMNQTLNARSETVFTLPSFRNSIKQKRCIILADGFYEWRAAAGRKYPYFIHLTNQAPFALGGIYNDWVNKESGEIIYTFSIITTVANPLMEKIHNSKKRMPLILSEKEEKRWIDPNLNSDEITEMMKPFDEKQMAAYTISKMITDKSINPDREEVQKYFEYPELIFY